MGDIRARGIVDGDAVGPVLVTPALSFLGDIDIRSGCIVGDHAGVKGQTLKGVMLVMPFTRGSAGAWRFLYQLSKVGTHPLAIITDDVPDPSVVQGAILAGIPVACAPEIKTADFAATGRQLRLSVKDGVATISTGS
jgi:phosphomecalonate degydratase small subunit